MPDEAREVIFPEGVHVLQGSEVVTDAPRQAASLPKPAPEPSSSEAEGDLLSDPPIDNSLDAQETQDDLLGNR